MTYCDGCGAKATGRCPYCNVCGCDDCIPICDHDARKRKTSTSGTAPTVTDGGLAEAGHSAPTVSPEQT